MTENASSADNQQERPLNPNWITGFVDGEGCFSISFVRQYGDAKRKGYITGYQVAHEFVITQGEKSLQALQRIKDFFGVGQVHINRRVDKHREPMYRYVVRRRDDLIEIIIPFFMKYPLQTAKQLDFMKFRQCVEIMNLKRHLTREGVVEISKIVETMNRQKSKQSLVGILRDYTSDTTTVVKI